MLLSGNVGISVLTLTQPAFTCSKLTIEALEQGVKYVPVCRLGNCVFPLVWVWLDPGWTSTSLNCLKRITGSWFWTSFLWVFCHCFVLILWNIVATRIGKIDLWNESNNISQDCYLNRYILIIWWMWKGKICIFAAQVVVFLFRVAKRSLFVASKVL